MQGKQGHPLEVTLNSSTIPDGYSASFRTLSMAEEIEF
jgi:hypothetical protein